MTDFFALFDEPRRPWLDLEALKKKFLARSAETHPDRYHAASEAGKQVVNQRYAELNAAYNCLREPKLRLLHLLELETGARPKDVQRIPSGTMDLAIEVGALCRDVDQFLAERAKVTSPLLKVQWFERSLEWTDRLNALQQRLQAKRVEREAELQTLAMQWDQAPPVGSPSRAEVLPLERVEQLYRAFSYLTRWAAQIQERLVQLAL